MTRTRTAPFRLPAIALLLAADSLPLLAAAPTPRADDSLDEIVVTGSLIPRARTETAVPTATITAEDLKERGFATVADALQQSAFSSGSVQGAQFTGGFTPGAQTLSLFGLSPSYVKYLIDGRPMSDYPALYNGTDVITNLSGIPEEMVDHIDILPGGQSSLYGSDAIAGVVNVVLKKKLDAAVFDFRLSGYDHGGGTDRRFSVANSFEFGGVHLLAGVQYSDTDPIWGTQRGLTSSYFGGGTGPAVAERDWLVYSPFSGQYYFQDPNGCANVTSQFNGTAGLKTRTGRGQYCGTTSTGWGTLNNGGESSQAYVHMTADLTDSMQLYGDALLNHDVTRFSTGTLFWTTDVGYNFGVIYDPNIDDYVGLQHIFSPEESGGVSNTLNPNTTNAARASLGLQGRFGQSRWTYDIGFTHTHQYLKEGTHVLWTGPVESYFASILGPNLGPDPYDGRISTFTPDYARFYTPLTPGQFASISGIAKSYSRTQDNMLRGQLTNSALFALPGGNAGIALVAEGGDQSWRYVPDPAFLSGGTWGYTAVAGDGHRSRYAATSELRLPVLKMLTLTASGRYDAYQVSGQKVDKATYNVGLEFRPLQSLLLRGRYGTAFKVPTLSDEFQGRSGFYQTVDDYYWCQKNNQPLDSCLNAGISVFGTTQGNPALQPINAKVYNIGLVWSPMTNLSFNLDYLHWGISNEVNQQSADKLLITENNCRQGKLDINSPTCVAALSQIVRDAFDNILSISTPKINVSDETVNAIAAEAHYATAVGRYGGLAFALAWNDLLKHTNQIYPGDPLRDALRDPTWSSEFKSKLNASVTWTLGRFSSTLYVNRHGRTPNDAATQDGYDAPRAGVLGPWTVANLSASYDWPSGISLTGNIINLFDKMPPTDTSYPGTSSSPYNDLNYDVYGRAFRLEASYRFQGWGSH